MKRVLLASAVFAALGFAGSAGANTIHVTGSSTNVGGTGNPGSASADFTITGNTLTIVLTNTSSGNGTEQQANTLTGIEFTFQNTRLALTPVSALVNTASAPGSIFNSGNCTVPAHCTGSNINVGGEWGLDNGTTAGLTTVDAIASAGYITTGISGNPGNFGGSDLNGNSGGSLDGIDFGILSSSHGSLDNGFASIPLIQNQVVLTLNGVSGDLANPGNVTGVTFLYGTALGEGSIGGTCVGACLIIPGGGGATPEPATIGLFGTALLGLAAARRRKQSN